MNFRCFGQAMRVARLTLVLMLPPGPGARGQHIMVDGRLSPVQTLITNYMIDAKLGRQVGGNLFHSFGAFGLNRGETATFSGLASVANVVGRVTGGAPSSIDGNLRSTIPGANLYLINPAGVIFGPNAGVKCPGASTPVRLITCASRMVPGFRPPTRRQHADFRRTRSFRISHTTRVRSL